MYSKSLSVILKHTKVGEMLHLSLKHWLIIRLNFEPNDWFRQQPKWNGCLCLLRNPLKTVSSEAKVRMTGTLEGREGQGLKVAMAGRV